MCLFNYLFFTDTATTQIYTLSLHDALPISLIDRLLEGEDGAAKVPHRGKAPHQCALGFRAGGEVDVRSEEHTSELQSRRDLVCRLLLEKKKNISFYYSYKYCLLLHLLLDCL